MKISTILKESNNVNRCAKLCEEYMCSKNDKGKSVDGKRREEIIDEILSINDENRVIILRNKDKKSITSLMDGLLSDFNKIISEYGGNVSDKLMSPKNSDGADVLVNGNNGIIDIELKFGNETNGNWGLGRVNKILNPEKANNLVNNEADKNFNSGSFDDNDKESSLLDVSFKYLSPKRRRKCLNSIGKTEPNSTERENIIKKFLELKKRYINNYISKYNSSIGSNDILGEKETKELLKSINSSGSIKTLTNRTYIKLMAGSDGKFKIKNSVSGDKLKKLPIKELKSDQDRMTIMFVNETATLAVKLLLHWKNNVKYKHKVDGKEVVEKIPAWIGLGSPSFLCFVTEK